MKRITIRAMINAMRKNGLPQAYYKSYVWDNEGNIVAGCALGQGLLNLGIKDNFDFADGPVAVQFRGETMFMNDNQQLKIPVIVDYLEETFKDDMRKVLYTVREN